MIEAFESFVGVNFWTMIFAWCNLLVLYIFLRKLLFKPVKNMIDSRQKEIDDMYSDAAKSKEDAAVIKAEYEENPTPENYLRLLYNNPAGFELTARLTTNYRCLRNVYQQRKNHYKLVA